MGRGTCLLVIGLTVWAGLTNPLGRGVAAIGAALLLLALAGWFRCGRYASTQDDDKAWARAGTIILIVQCAATVAWALAFDSNQSSDFGIYYRCGTSLKPILHDWMESCRSHYFYQPDYTYWSRALVYSAPFGMVFGDNYVAFKLYNAALHAATLALLFYGLRQVAGARPAVIALVLLGIYPEWFFAITVATPDNLVVALLLAFLLLVPALMRAEGARAWAVVVALAALAFVANLARTVGPFLVIALALTVLVNLQRARWKGPLIRLAAVLVLYNLANVALVTFIGKPVQGQFAFFQRISTIDLHAPMQNYRLVFGWLDQFLPVVPDAARGKVTAKKIIAEFAQGFGNYPEYLLAKTRVFVEGTGYYLYASTDAGANPDSARTAAAFTVPTFAAMLVALAAIVLFTSSLAGFALLRSRRTVLIDACSFLVASICLVILGFGDTQQRYSLLVAAPLAIIAALALFSPTAPASADRRSPAGTGVQAGGAHLGWTLAGCAAILLVYLAGSKLAAAVALRIPQPLALARQEGDVRANGTACNSRRIALQGDYKRLRVTPAPSGGCFSFWAPLPVEARSVSFFLSRDEFPFPFEPRTPVPYAVRVEHAGTVLYEGQLGLDVVQWHRFNLAGGSAAGNGLRFIVTPLSASATEPLDVWWLTSSSTAVPDR
jgi:4-amino-4-deoxy-L-arabinose transferase-like glycosyltransferase